jgi:hypothetical protein
MTRRPSAPPDIQMEGDAKPRGFDDFDLRLGDIMRGERATMGKSLLDVQRELKIKATYISAIENADPSAFETPGFVAGYVRSYARYLNLDPDWAFKTFCEEGNFTNPAGLGSASKASAKPAQEARGAGSRDPFVEPKVSFIPKGEAALSGIEPRAVGSVAVLFALIAAIGYGGWSVLQEVQKVQFTPIDQAPGVLAELDPMSEAPEQLAGLPDDAEITAPATEAFDRLYRPQALDVPVLTPRDGPIATLDPSTVGVLTPQPDPIRETEVADIRPLFGPAQPGAEETALGQSVQVVEEVPEVALLAVRPSWVRVQGADGTIIFEKILDAGERFVLPPSDEPHRLRAGNAGSLYFSVGGETYGPAGDGPSVVRDVALSIDALKQSYSVADLSSDADLARFTAVAEAQTDAATD